MNVVVLWHMHQPYYVNPLTKKAMMPWVRLHAAKGYLDMIDLVTAQPDLRINFNFTPVLVRQILELVNREVQDEWENLSRKRAVDLDLQDRRHLLENFFKINWDTLIRPMPRYAELLAKRGAGYTTAKLDSLVKKFSDADFRLGLNAAQTTLGAKPRRFRKRMTCSCRASVSSIARWSGRLTRRSPVGPAPMRRRSTRTTVGIA